MLYTEISKCRIDYFENRCLPSERVRALEEYCDDKERCMNQDPNNINKNTKIFAKLLAEIINDFFEPLSYKTMALIAIVLVVLIVFSECLMGKNRKETTITKVKKID